MERIMVFIDGSNLYHLLKGIYGTSKNLSEFDFSKFVNLLCKDRKLIRTYYYNGILNQQRDPEQYRKQQRFFGKLRAIQDFEVITCRMQKDVVDGETRYSVKEDDISIAVDMVKLAFNNAYDAAILVSIDGDFVPAVRVVKETGKKVESVGFVKRFSWHLKQTCDKLRMLKKEELDKCFP